MEMTVETVKDKNKQLEKYSITMIIDKRANTSIYYIIYSKFIVFVYKIIRD